MATLARLIEDALDLPDRDRADLAAELLASLTPATAAEERTDEQWLTEIERRGRDALAGAAAIPWTDARAEIQRRVRARHR